MTRKREALVLDASVLINILATGAAREIFAALSERCLVPEPVVGEIKRDPLDRKNSVPLTPYVDEGLLTVAKLEGPALATFMAIVSAPLEEALDDGEAATLAIAHHDSHAAAIDENKARNVAARRFAGVRCVRTVELLRRPEVIGRLIDERFSQAVASALEFGRMQVPTEHQEWAWGVVGANHAGRFPSLKPLPSKRGKGDRPRDDD